MADVKFHDYSAKVKAEMKDRAVAVLWEVTGELEGQTKRNTRVKSGKTKGSWQSTVKDDGTTIIGTVGSPEENTIWEEFGTGDYALGGNGRKGGWYYVDEDGKGHFTHGKKPSRAFWRAYTALKNALIKRIQDAFKGL